VCAGGLITLECGSPHEQIVFVRSIDKYSTYDCPSSDRNSAFEQCTATSELTDWPVQSGCGSENAFNSSCTIQLAERTHSKGWNSANCDFSANLRNIFYRCIPSKFFFFFDDFLGLPIDRSHPGEQHIHLLR
jgi:hypothetical protein